MRKQNIQKAKWTIIFLTMAIVYQIAASAYVSVYDLMKCSYGERGSLTATCVNATPTYFKNTPYRFDQLDETLRCITCSLQTIDTGTFDISGNQIRFLDLSRSQIEMLKQKAFVGLIFLEELNLSNNSIRSIYPGTFTGVKKITRIDLSYNSINILSDDGFLELINLDTLNIGYNKIHTIARKAFNGLVKLKKLYLRDNLITSVNEVLGNLTSLEILDLADNHISILTGQEFYNLTSLVELNLSNNKLKTLVIGINPQNTLKNLFLQNNNIDKITYDFLKGFNFLEELDLSYNQIMEIEQKTLQNLNKLRSINLSHNKLLSFQTGTYSGIPHLESLNCSQNSIDAIEITGVFSLHSLHSLDLSHNSISDLDYVGLISRLPRLSYLRLEDNQLHCDLEDEMVAYFAEDNFKFILYDNNVGAKKCIDTPTRARVTKTADILVAEKVTESSGSSGAEITIFVLMTIAFVCIGFLSYLQYRTYQELKLSSPNRSTSTSHLMTEEVDSRDNDNFLKE